MSGMIFDPVIMDVDCGDEEKTLLWHSKMRQAVYVKRPRRCDGCGKRLKYGFDLHEGVVSRQDVRGWKYPMKAQIFTEYNCVLLCPDCNRNNPPSRQAMWDLQCQRYGEVAMREWYEGLPWRAGVPRRFWNG
jgi:hypothetical protein